MDGGLGVVSSESVRHVRNSAPWLDRLFGYKLAQPELLDGVVPNAWVRREGDDDRYGDIGVYLIHIGRDLGIPDRLSDLVFIVDSTARRVVTNTMSKDRINYQIIFLL